MSDQELKYIKVLSNVTIAFFLLAVVRTLQAEVITDGTVGAGQNLGGPDYMIPESLGSRAGSNLFHSFQNFNLYSGESATFTGSADITRVISRVTGGGPSTIDGLLSSQVGQADFFFINPSGVLFGANAQIEVPAAFHVSTADELRFSDGTVYSASNPQASTLSVASPESFGFGGMHTAQITVDQSQLIVAPENTLSLVGGELVVDEALLEAEGGEIHLTATGDAQTEVNVESGSTDTAINGTISISGSSALDVSGTQGSQSVELRGGQVEVKDSMIAADHAGSGASAGRILLEADGVGVINSDIHAQVFGAGRGNDIVVIAEELEIDAATAVGGRSRLTTRVMSADGSGTAGDVKVEADQVSLTNGGQLSSIVLDGASGQGGSVELRATDSITIDGSNEVGFYSGLYTTVLTELNAQGGEISIDSPMASLGISGGAVLQSGTNGAGQSGSVTITVQDLDISNDAWINSSTIGSGNAGAIEINTTGNVTIDNGVLWAGSEGSGNAGTIDLSANMIEMQQGKLNVNTSGSGNAGVVHLDAKDSILLTNNSLVQAFSGSTFSDLQPGGAGNININTQSFTMVDSSIDVFSSSLANAGIIEVIADEISIDTTAEGSSGLDASNSADLTFAPAQFEVAEEGRSGTITLNASKILLNHDVDVSINTNAGNGGSVVISAGELHLLNGANLNSIPTGPGRGGDIRVDVTGTFLIEGEDNFMLPGGILTSPVIIDHPGFGVETGPAGAITISAGALIIGLNSRILSDSFSSASAGSITLNVGSLEVKDGGEISSGAGADGPGADIVINADQFVTVRGTDPVLLLDSSSISANASFSETRAGGEGGSIQINSALLVLEQGGALSSETSSSGSGGTIDVAAGELVIRSGGAITTDSFATGSAGAININAKSFLLSNANAPLLFQALGGAISSKAVATGAAGTIDIAVDELTIRDCGKITTASLATAPAGAIHIDVSNLLLAENAQITTAANLGNGGPIELIGGSIVLRDSLVTTSVEGAGGDGGDMLVSADALVVDTGFIQANTAGAEARGGNVLIDKPFLIPSRGIVQVGGTVQQSFQSGSGINVIQAAAPQGISGEVNITAPELDVNTALLGLSTNFAQIATVVKDPCQIARGRQLTSLVWVGRGGVPSTADDPATVLLHHTCSKGGMEPETSR